MEKPREPLYGPSPYAKVSQNSLIDSGNGDLHLARGLGDPLPAQLAFVSSQSHQW